MRSLASKKNIKKIKGSKTNMNISKQEALKKIEELKQYIDNLNREEEFITIDYTKIRKELFEKYGAFLLYVNASSASDTSYIVGRLVL